MKIWNFLQQRFGWIGVVLTFLVAAFPKAFAKIGATIKFLVVGYWLQMSVLTIILLLLFVSRLLLKQQKG
ncbi:hypothetical protein [Neobacillus massiliamazoniensis]|uniref:Uncharacterized protein n=1 Tax=Neobacillus massiliamazoniensis TaxID=1499688 RepID=A0A0U1NQR1_9BACI|nr:hypothetical protein [Neobacillus massiliamazoniensis]CRK80381.1 hypothetical protein BN000_00264 [Neobacillus massiliamazoniensis]